VVGDTQWAVKADRTGAESGLVGGRWITVDVKTVLSSLLIFRKVGSGFIRHPPTSTGIILAVAISALSAGGGICPEVASDLPAHESRAS
jgi:hypothetical protein